MAFSPARDAELVANDTLRSRVVRLSANIRDLAALELIRVVDNSLTEYNVMCLQRIITVCCTISVRARNSMDAGVAEGVASASLTEMAASLRLVARALNVQSHIIDDMLAEQSGAEDNDESDADL